MPVFARPSLRRIVVRRSSWMLVMAEREELGSNILHLDEPLQRPRLIANIELDDALILLTARILPDRIFGNDSVQPSKMTVKTSPT
jgi:hypothetical protein